jgi:ribonuclease P protein subunit RPR2
MARAKPKEISFRVPNRHTHSRMAFLFQAANYLANIPPPSCSAAVAPAVGDQAVSYSTSLQTEPNDTDCPTNGTNPGLSGPSVQHRIGFPAYYGSHLLTITRKSQAKLSTHVKRSLCKVCSSLLIPGKTSSARIENKSRGGKKPWADVLVVECLSCGSSKRFPVGAKRQTKKKLRGQDQNAEPAACS